MTEPAGVLVPIQSSPLRVRRRDGRFLAEDAAGALAFLGTPGAPGSTDSIVIETASGAWRIQRPGDSAREVLDRSGHVVATVCNRAFRATLIELPSGESIPVTTGMFRLFGMGCRIGRLAAARAPFFRPGRYFKLTLRDALLARPDCELLVAVGALIADGVISTQIAVAATSPSP